MTMPTIEELNKDAYASKEKIAKNMAMRILEAYKQTRMYTKIDRRVGTFTYYAVDNEKNLEILEAAAALIKQGIPNATIKPLGAPWWSTDSYIKCEVTLD